MAYINPIKSLMENLKKIVEGSTVKFSNIADAYDTLDNRKQDESYMSAIMKNDTFSSYLVYEPELLERVGITDPDMIEHYTANRLNIPVQYRDQLLDLKRAKIISEFVETNDYYRKYMGLPDVNDTSYIYVTDMQDYGISPTTPIHQMDDANVGILQETGKISQLASDYPDKEYIKFLGNNSISIDILRKAKNFALIKTPSSTEVLDNLLSQFKMIYEQCREYYMTVLYVKEYQSIYSYYDNFIGMCIMVMTIQQIIARSTKTTIDRDFFDEYCITMLFDMYRIPELSGLDSNDKRAICQNLNKLIQMKSTDKVLYNIANILGFDNIAIYKYLLVKQQKYDSNDVPIMDTITEQNEEGETITRPDYPARYDVYFQKLEVKDDNIYEALQNERNRVGYRDIIISDPFWQEDDELTAMLYESEYNYAETKYLSVNISFKLTEVMFESIYFLNMCMDKNNEISSINVTLPKLTEDTQIPIFDAVIAVCEMLSRKNHLGGEIVTSPSQILYVLGFNFENDFAAIRQDIINNPYINNGLTSYLMTMDIVNASNINTMYKNLQSMKDEMTEVMASTNDINVYNAYEKLYKTIFIKAAQNTAFNMGTDDNPNYATTYAEFLEFHNYELYSVISAIEPDQLTSYISHILSKLGDVVDDLKYLYYINDSTGGSIKALLTLIRFFKSYTTDMIGLNIVYLFDTKALNMLRLIDKVSYIEKEIDVHSDLKLSHSDFIQAITIQDHENDDFTMYDSLSYELTE